MHIQASWGGFELVDIAKELFRAALTDTANQKMVLLSESCLPLYPATLTYAQLISEPKSRINACHDWVRCLQISFSRCCHNSRSMHDERGTHRLLSCNLKYPV